MKIITPLILIASAMLFSCANEPLEDSNKYEPAALQESHVITYKMNDDETSVETLIKTGAGENYNTGELNGGKYVMLKDPASLKVNGEAMILDSSRFVGYAYTWVKKGFVKDVKITYTNKNKESFDYAATTKPIDMKEDFLQIWRDGDGYFLKWIGDPIGESEEVSLYLEYKEKDQKGKSKTKNIRIDNDRAGESWFNISSSDLDKLLNNDRIEIYAERKTIVKASSSSNPVIVIYKYVSDKRYVKTKKNLLDMIISN